MNTHRYDVEKRKQWVKDKLMRIKTVRQICSEAAISRATLYNWLEEFKDLTSSPETIETASTPKKSARPELISRSAPEAAERYNMLVAAIAGTDTNRQFSKKLVAALIKRFTITAPQACEIVGMEVSAYGYKPRKPEAEDYIVYQALIQLIHEDRTRDFESCCKLLAISQPDWPRKQIKRVYRDGMVYLERKRSNARWEKQRTLSDVIEKKQSIGAAVSRIQKPGAIWHLGHANFSHSLNGHLEDVWCLFIIDEESDAVLNAVSGTGLISTEEMLNFLEQAMQENGRPAKLKMPDSGIFQARELTRWVWQNRMTLYKLSLNKPENREWMAALQQRVLHAFSLATISSKQELKNVTENWIGSTILV